MSHRWTARSGELSYRGGGAGRSSVARLASLGDEHGDDNTFYASALAALILGSYFLSTHYYTSAAFQRPLHFVFVTLIFHTALLRMLRPWIAQEAHSSTAGPRGQLGEIPFSEKSEKTRWEPLPHDLVLRSGFDFQRNSTFLFIAAAIIVRSWLFFYIGWTTQCATIGLETFRVLYIYVCERGDGMGRIWGMPIGTTAEAWPRWKSFTFVKFALSWALATNKALEYAKIPTDAVCPDVWWYEGIWVFQILTIALDAYLCITLSSVRQRLLEQRQEYSSLLTKLSLIGAAGAVIMAFTSWIEDQNIFWALSFRYRDVVDLFVDGTLAALVLTSGFYLFAFLSPSTVAFTVTSLTMFGVHIPYYGLGALLPPQSLTRLAGQMAFAAVSAAPMWCLIRPPNGNPRPEVTTVLHRWLRIAYASVTVLCGCFWLISSPKSTMAGASLSNGGPDTSLAATVEWLSLAGNEQSSAWQEQALQSTTLQEAVAEYQTRYGMPPPPNFDQWYEFATKLNSPVIDDFAQIHSDLLPFWGMDPATIRQNIHEIQKYASVEMVGLRIRQGQIEKSPHIREDHQWMMDSVERMVQPFAQWLPDMDIPINVADEPRVALTYTDIEDFKTSGLQTQERLNDNSALKEAVSDDQVNAPAWPTEFPSSIGAEGKHLLPSGFTNYIRKPILHDLIADTCPPGSAIRTTRWWDQSTSCTACFLPQSIFTDDGALLFNDTLASDPCHQPDLLRLAGSISSPAAMFATRNLYPVFSQGRLGGFADILMPSPWSFDDLSPYDESEDIDWVHKSNSLFWRGGSTDGYAAEGSWTGFLRARFVNGAYKRFQSLSRRTERNPNDLIYNISFSGELSRCHSADCQSEAYTFAKWTSMTGHTPTSSEISIAAAERNNTAPVLPFSSHWHHKHLMDMDGAGFSGRFLPFLQSKSLVYHAGLYRTWMDERVHAWRHYIPVDIRLGNGFWSLVEYLGGGRGASGRREGERIAAAVADQGREWAGRALRKEDMQIYMFRLLLEWGRVVDDERERLYYDG